MNRLGKPVAGRVLFAGEATAAARYGYADGAFTTGVREAKRLLQQPTVEIGSLGAMASRPEDLLLAPLGLVSRLRNRTATRS